MNSSTTDKIQGAVHQVKGAVKAEVGKHTDNPTLAAKGKAEQLAGKVQSKVGQVKQVLGK